MKLSRVEITNYRSIKSETFYFSPRCRVLVGINESGKSNVLNALSLLSNEYEPKASDERQQLPDEEDNKKVAEVMFVFDLDDNDYKTLRQDAEKQILTTPNAKIVQAGETKYNFSQFCKTIKEGLYLAKIATEKKTASYWAFDKEKYQIIEGWKKPSANCPADFSIKADENTVLLKDFKLIKPNETWTIPENYLTDATIEDVFSLAGSNVINLVNNELPEVVYWKYAENQLLSEQIPIADFIANPTSSIPLKNMFNLAGIEDISDQITKAQKRSDTTLNNLLRKVALKSTDYLQGVWKEYKDVSFSLSKNGDFIQCTVHEQNDYPAQDRSDGFKKFIAFLLMVSSRAHTGTIKNALILIDEPDSGLHPSGARYLRDELLKISRDNDVVYSTHSIFMIDRHDIRRHLIVAKTSEITTLTVADEGNIVEEEVIFNAINYSTFEHLKELTIIFEGWRDKKLFKTYIASYQKPFFSKLGIAHAFGVPTFRTLIPTLELAEREALIISDNDTTAKQHKTEYIKLRYATGWKTYEDVSPSTEAITGEDFLKKDYLVASLKTVTAANGTGVVISASDLPDNDRLKYIKAKVQQNGYGGDDLKNVIEAYKSLLFDNLIKSKIEDRYKTFVDDIKSFIEPVLNSQNT